MWEDSFPLLCLSFPVLRLSSETREVMDMRQETQWLSAGTRLSAQAARTSPRHGALLWPPLACMIPVGPRLQRAHSRKHVQVATETRRPCGLEDGSRRVSGEVREDE